MPNSRSRKNTLINLAGLLLALAIASGGLLGVQARLAHEEASLLQGGGMVELSVASDPSPSEEVDVQVPGTPLTEEELTLVIQSLESGAEPYPHAPGQSQLSMAEAMEQGRSWLESFFMPHLGVTDFHLSEQKTGCYLWTVQEDTPLLSYWTVTFSAKNLEAELILNASSGQVLDASVRCALPTQSQDTEDLMDFLDDYASSFGLKEQSVLIENDGDGDYNSIISPADDSEMADSIPRNAEIYGRTMYQSIGSQGIFAALNVNRIVFSCPVQGETPDVDYVQAKEILSIRLRLTSKLTE